MEKSRLRALLPFTLSLVLLAADQITKAWVVATIPQGTVGHSFLSDFLWICHVRNSAIGFSIGDGLPETAKRILFIALPLVVMVVLVIHMIRSGELRVFQRWMVAGIVGGGAGNLLDPMFRPSGSSISSASSSTDCSDSNGGRLQRRRRIDRGLRNSSDGEPALLRQGKKHGCHA